MDGFSKTDDDSSSDDESALSDSELPLNDEDHSRRRRGSDVKLANEEGLSGLERRMTSPIGIRGGSVGPGGGRKLSNALAASNMGQGTGGTSFA